MFRRGEQEERDKPIEAREVRMSEGASTEVTVVGQGARLEGTVLSAGSLRIDGQVKGKITADGDVALSAQSQVEADISATNVTIAGKFKGNITAKSRAELAKGGRVDGNITAKTLVVSEGATFNGQSLMDQTTTGAAATTSSSESTKADGTTRIEEPAKAR
jgi:cytoskeletal protein CcmA (bactofilin family)